MLTFEEYQYKESLLGDLKTRFMGKKVGAGYEEVLAAVVEDLPINTLNAKEAQSAANAAWSLVSTEMSSGNPIDVEDLARRAARAAADACGFKISKHKIEPNLRVAISRVMKMSNASAASGAMKKAASA